MWRDARFALRRLALLHARDAQPGCLRHGRVGRLPSRYHHLHLPDAYMPFRATRMFTKPQQHSLFTYRAAAFSIVLGLRQTPVRHNAAPLLLPLAF